MAAFNLGLRFALELAMLAGLSYWGFTLGGSWFMRVVAGIGAPFVALVVWGVFIAPKGLLLLPAPARLGLEVLLFGLAAGALMVAGREDWAIGLAGVAGINIVLMFVFGQR